MPDISSLIHSSHNRAHQEPEIVVALAVAAARNSADQSDLNQALQRLPVPIYLTNAEGMITFFNTACIDFAGRIPELGKDRWCVSWKLYREDGSPLPHEQCPMAVTIREHRPVRGAVAVAERPDGTRVLFTPFPTPVFEDDGALAGAVNILIDITDARQAQALREQATRCRRLARSITDERAVNTLKLMAAEYDEKASTLLDSDSIA